MSFTNLRLCFLKAFLLILSCGAAAACGKTEALSVTPSGIVVGADGHAFAIVRLRGVIDECSNAGGEHYTFEIDEPGRRTPRLAHGGGHMAYARLVPSSSEPAQKIPNANDEYVAELALRSTATPADETDERRPNPGWCLDSLPKFDAEVYRVIKAPNHATAQRMLEDAASLGLAPPSSFARVSPPPHGVPAHVAAPGTESHAISVVRVRSFEGSTFDRRHVAFESVEGHAALTPTSVDVSPDQKWRPWLGDIVVVESSGSSGVARVLATTDKESALRWGRHIRTHGWPRSPTDMSEYANLATERWLVTAKVVRGPPGCGLVLEAPNGGDRSNVILPKMHAPAPNGLRLDDTATAVVVARFGDDSCGNNLRAVRIYRGARNSFTGEIPAGVPLVE